MTELRKRMIESLQLRGLSERTQEAYVRAVRQLADHYRKSPDLITDEELRQYFLHIKNVKKYSRASSTIAICGIKFFFEKTLNREFTKFKLVRAQREKKLPVILSVEEVLTILGRVRLPRYRVCLGTIYSCGLRLQEGTHIQVRDIDSGRGMLHVRYGKGGKDRYVPLPQRTVELLRFSSGDSNNRILKLEDGRVTFKYKDSATDQVKYATASAEEFMRRFLQHVLPERFVTVRYYGLLSPGKRRLLKRAREALGTRASASAARSADGATNQRELLRCPSCGNEMTLIGTLSARGRGRLNEDRRIFRNSEREYVLFSDVGTEVCASASNNVRKAINESVCVRPR